MCEQENKRKKVESLYGRTVKLDLTSHANLTKQWSLLNEGLSPNTLIDKLRASLSGKKIILQHQGVLDAVSNLKGGKTQRFLPPYILVSMSPFASQGCEQIVRVHIQESHDQVNGMGMGDAGILALQVQSSWWVPRTKERVGTPWVRTWERGGWQPTMKPRCREKKRTVDLPYQAQTVLIGRLSRETWGGTPQVWKAGDLARSSLEKGAFTGFSHFFSHPHGRVNFFSFFV